MPTREALLGVSSDEFRDLDMSGCRVQTAEQRFGHGSADIMKARVFFETASYFEPIPSDSDSDSDSESGAQGEATSGAQPSRPSPPKLQDLRMNLTALSQVYNLYFAAYRGKIWVYCPVGPFAQGLGHEPALVINHAVSPIGAHIPPRIPGWTPEEANHMIVGFLGDAEILLLCFENGDVEAYYTREIAGCISHHPQIPGSASRPPPRPFFVANVGDSAWGLAIHSKSRLIAVSSNRFEVTVFAFALTRAPPPGRFLKPPHSPFETAVLSRKRNWRIVLPVKPAGHNIPNIDFVSTPHGHAQKISAADVKGNLWLLDIWRHGTAPALITPQDFAWQGTNRERLWGVVALPECSFLDLGKTRPDSPIFSSEASHARAIALGNGGIAIRVPSRRSTYWIDSSGALSFLQDSRFSGHTQHHSLYNNLPVPSLFPETPLLYSAFNENNQDDEAGEESAENSFETENDDGESDDEDDDEDELDEGLYDEDDLEVEINSSASGAIGEDSITNAPYNWSVGPSTGSSVGFTLLLEAHLPNEMDQPLEHSGMASRKVHPQADGRRRLAVASKSQYLGPANQPPQVATEQLEGNVDRQLAPRMAMIYIPHKTMTYREPASIGTWAEWLTRGKEYNKLSTEQSEAEIARIGEHTSFFVTNKSDLRLITPSRRFVDLVCQGPTRDTSTNHLSRVNMTLHVPELNLVVAACQTGRVALVSLIKYPWALPTASGDRSVRVDKILPTVSEEDERKVRPKVSLFGMAMGPVQEVEDGTLRLRSRRSPASFSPKYRLILHYRDHTILSYLVSRPSPDDLQVV